MQRGGDDRDKWTENRKKDANFLSIWNERHDNNRKTFALLLLLRLQKKQPATRNWPNKRFTEWSTLAANEAASS